MTTDQSSEAFEALRAALSKCSKMTVHDIDWVPLHEVLILLENPSFGWQAARQAEREAGRREGQFEEHEYSCSSAAGALRARRTVSESSGEINMSDKLRTLLGELYQVLGVLGAPANVLDQVSAGAAGKPLPHDTLLPFADPDSAPHCLGYPDCDGDLPGEAHSQKCPLFNQEDVAEGLDSAPGQEALDYDAPERRRRRDLVTAVMAVTAVTAGAPIDNLPEDCQSIVQHWLRSRREKADLK